MSENQDWLSELKSIRRQMSDDFQFNALTMGSLARDLTNALTSLAANVSGRLNQVEGRMRLMDHRFGKMMDAVETGLESNRSAAASKAEVEELRRRIEKLEQERPGA